MSNSSPMGDVLEVSKPDGVSAQNAITGEAHAANTNSTLSPPLSTSPSELTATTYAFRQAARFNSANVPDAERQALLKERQLLLDKLFDGQITRQQEIRLEYVRWSLDRIEDANHGEYLDLIESHIEHYERWIRELTAFRTELERQAHKK